MRRRRRLRSAHPQPPVGGAGREDPVQDPLEQRLRLRHNENIFWSPKKLDFRKNPKKADPISCPEPVEVRMTETLANARVVPERVVPKTAPEMVPGKHFAVLKCSARGGPKMTTG